VGIFPDNEVASQLQRVDVVKLVRLPVSAMVLEGTSADPEEDTTRSWREK
jgi:hypothetical protein